jgi:nitrate reductase gamma subunit
MRREVLKAAGWASLFTGVLALLIWIGSRRLSHFDAALVAYTFASLFATFGISYRYAMWLQRPPTALYWRRGWQVFLRRGHRASNLALWFKRVLGEFAANDFIWRRDPLRGLTHGLIMWGCVLAAAITFPLVFGWISFESLPDGIDTYRIVVFGLPTIAVPSGSWLAFGIFHGLVWAAFLVIPGVMLAMRRRMRDEGAAAQQSFSEDMLPLILLFAVSLTGLLLTVSYTWLHGSGYEFLSLTHAVTVIFTLLWLPFGKFFHIFQRPAQLGVEFYKDVAASGEPAACRRCGHAFSSRMHVSDLERVERELGYRYEVADPTVGHYQWICPRCRRAMLALAQGRLAGRGPGGDLALPAPMPVYANPGQGEGPLGAEDAANFHP